MCLLILPIRGCLHYVAMEGGGGIHGKMPRDQEGVQCALRPKERALVRFGYPRTLSDKSGQKEFLNGLLFNRHRACSYW